MTGPLLAIAGVAVCILGFGLYIEAMERPPSRSMEEIDEGALRAGLGGALIAVSAGLFTAAVVYG